MSKLNRKDWLKERKKALGGSDAAAILGLNPYCTPYAVWADKTGRLPETPDNEAMRQGRDLEQYVAERFTGATGKKVRRRTNMLRNLKYPFAHANIDRWVVGENAGLECKTTSLMNLKRFKNGEYPETYYCQCVHYMAVTGADCWYLAVLVLNQGFYWYCIKRDEDEIEALMAAEKEFWQLVETDAPPPVDGFKPTSDILNTIYAYTIGNTTPVELFGRETLLAKYLQLGVDIKALEQDKELLSQILKEDLQVNEKGCCGNFEVNWRKQIRNSFQTKDFIADYPELDLSPYYKQSEYRVFTVKEKK